MSTEGGVTFFLDGGGRVTRVSISGEEDLLSDIVRLSGIEFSLGEKSGEFIPCGKLVFRDFLESHDFYQRGLEGIADVFIESDRELVGFGIIICALENHLSKVESPEERQALSTIIDHVCLSRWNGACEGGCGVCVPVSEVIRNLSTLCEKCRAMEE